MQLDLETQPRQGQFLLDCSHSASIRHLHYTHLAGIVNTCVNPHSRMVVLWCPSRKLIRHFIHVSRSSIRSNQAKHRVLSNEPRTENRWKIEKGTKNMADGKNKVSFWGRKVRSNHKKDTQKKQLFPTPRCRRFQRFACVSPRWVLFQTVKTFDPGPARHDRSSFSEETAQTWTS